MFWELVLVFILAILAGGWSVTAGVLFGLEPISVYIAAVLGSVSFTLVVLFFGGKVRDSVSRRFFPDIDQRVADSKASEILNRWGIIGLALVGSTLLGPSITLAAALILGVDRNRFLFWYVVSTVVGFALLTLFWVLVLEN